MAAVEASREDMGVRVREARMIPWIDALVKDHHLPPQMEWMILDLMRISMNLAGRSPRACCRPGDRKSVV